MNQPGSSSTWPPRLRAVFVLAPLLAVAACAHAQPRWETLPDLPPMPAAEASGDVVVDDARIHWASWGKGAPVVLLHGAVGNGEYFALQARALTPRYRVIAIDSRGQGRSTRGGSGLHYHLMAEDVVVVLDALGIGKAAVVGWSDGGIIALDLAMHHGDRLTKVFAFAANTDLEGLRKGGGKTPTMQAYFTKARTDTLRLSPAPDEVDKAIDELDMMSSVEPSYTAEDLGAITVPVAIADGDHDEVIRLEHTKAIAQRIQGAKLIIFEDASHFALWQAPDEFNRALVEFLDAP